MNFADARKWMVDGQVRPNKVTDLRISHAMLELPRHLFVPAELAARAHADDDVPLGHGRSLMKPMFISRLIQTADVKEGEQVLVLGAGTGYGAALLARLGARVTAVESDASLVALARKALAETSVAPGSLQLVEGNPAEGGPAGVSYDVIVIDGEVASIPAAVSDRLSEGGRLVAIRRLPGRAGAAVLGRRAGGTFSVTEVCDASAAPVPGFEPAPSFAL